MQSHRNILVGTAVAALLSGAAIAETTGAASGVDTTRVKIGTASHRENGCNQSGHNFKFVIPNPEQLDLGYNGVLAGIERVYTEGNGTRADNNYAFTDNGTAIVFSLFAKGGGSYVRPPIGGGWCAGATGANVAVEIYAHYRTKS
jgi:hypothetical protein